MLSEIQDSASKINASTRLRKRLHQEKARLMRLATIGNHADRLGALTVLAYSFDRVDRNVDENVIWMNATSQRDARAILDAVRSSKRSSSRLLSASEFDRVIFQLDRLHSEIRLEHLERRGIVKPCILMPFDERDDMLTEEAESEEVLDIDLHET